MIRQMFVAAVAVSAAVVSPSVAAAQGTSCEDAAVRVSVSPLPAVGAREWNDWIRLTGCGTRGATVIAGALQSGQIRGETELTRLDHLSGILDGWFQPQLIAAYEWLIRSPEASNAIRLRSMWLLSGLYAPGVDVAGPLQGYMSARCETYGRSTSLRDAPQSLPAEAYDHASDAIAYAADDRSAPEYVRTTASCWQGVIQDELKNGTQDVQGQPQGGGDQAVLVNTPSPIIVERPVRVVYECDSRFLIYNDAGYDLAVRYTGYGNGVLRVAHGGPYVWAPGRFGPVHFWVDDREIWYNDAVYRPCGGRVIIAPAVQIWSGWHFGLGVFLGTRYVTPRYVRPRGWERPIIIRRRGDGDRDDGWRDPRNGSHNDPRNGSRNDPRNGSRNGSGDDPRNGSRNGSRNDPRTAVPRGGGRQSDATPNGGQWHGSIPLQRPVQAQPRYAVPPNCCAVRTPPSRSAAPTGRSAQPSKGGGQGSQGPGNAKQGGGGHGGGRTSQFHGKPER